MSVKSAKVNNIYNGFCEVTTKHFVSRLCG